MLIQYFHVIIITAFMFFVDWTTAFGRLGMIVIGFIPLILMFIDGMMGMQPWYAAGEYMNKTIIEYISGMEVIKVFTQQSRSFK